jgi:hypothetical protein
LGKGEKMKHDSPFAFGSNALFKSPLESGLRVLILLTHAYPKAFDTQRLVSLDYLLVHSGDANGPESIHPPTPLRAGELLVRRELIEKGIMLLLSRSLIERELTREGIYFKANDNSAAFLDSLSSSYVSSLREVADWVIDNFGSLTDHKLEQFFRKNMDKWGREFEQAQVVAGRLL